MVKYAKIIILLILATVAIGLGVLIYNQRALNQTGLDSFPASMNNNPTPASSSTTDNSTVRRKEWPQPLPSFIGQAELNILNTPTSSTSAEARNKHFDNAVAAAKTTNTLEIDQCFGKPTVIKVKKGQSLTLKNSDPIDHVMVIDAKTQFKVPANKSVQVNINMEKSGLYGYGCDNYTKATGMILVSE